METIYIKCEPDCEEDLSDSIFNADAQVAIEKHSITLLVSMSS